MCKVLKDCLNEVNINDIGIAAGIEYHNKIYFSAYVINGLFELDINTGITKFIKRFDKEESRFAIHREACFYGDIAWFIPQMGEYIAIVNLKTFEIEYVDLIWNRKNNMGIKYAPSAYYSLVNVGKKKVFLIPSILDVPLLIDMEKQEIEPYYNIIDVDNELYLFGAYDEEYIWMVPKIGNKIIKIDLNNHETEKIECIGKREGYSGITYFEGTLWQAPYNTDSIQKINVKEFKSENIEPNSINLIEEKCENIINVGNDIWFLPCFSHHIVKYDNHKKNVAYIEIEKDLLYENAVYYRIIPSKSYIAFASACNGCCQNYHFIMYDAAGKVLKKIKPSICCTPELLNYVLNDLKIENLIFYENHHFNVDFLFQIAGNQEKEEIKGECGKKIYQQF